MPTLSIPAPIPSDLATSASSAITNLASHPSNPRSSCPHTSQSSTCTIHLSNTPCSSVSYRASSPSILHSFTWTIPNIATARSAELPVCRALSTSSSPGKASTVYIRSGECNLLAPSHDGKAGSNSDGVPDGVGGFDLIGAFEDEKCIVSGAGNVLKRNVNESVDLAARDIEASAQYRVRALWDFAEVSKRRKERMRDGTVAERDDVIALGERYACWDIGISARSFVVVGYGQKF